MMDLVCPFSATLVKRDFNCTHADHVVRRGGAEIACQSIEVHAECCAIHAKIRQRALSAMGLEDDLLTVPHAVLVKIQYGGLLGLQAVMENQIEVTDDIAALISRVRQRYADLDTLPFESINSMIESYRLSRRSRK
jgi:hypothetical protein